MSAGDALVDRLAGAESVRTARAALGDARAWIVGGAVRDALLGEPVEDLDIAIPPGAEREAAAAIADAAEGSVFALSREHATWRAIAGDRRWHCDVTALREETIEADLRARDFALNAIAVPLSGGDPIDPTGGIADTEARLLRVASPRAFAEDPLRLLRAARIGAHYGLSVDPATIALARAEAPRAAEPAGERQFAELRGILAGPAPLRALELMDELKVTAPVLPEVEAMRGVIQTPNHHLDVLGHTLAVIEQLLAIESDLPRFAGDAAPDAAALLAEPLADELDRRGALRFGALLHDIGKPATRSEQGGRVSFIGHDASGGEMIAALCERLKVSRRLSVHLQGLARHHLRLGFLVHERPLTRRRLYEYLDATEPVGPDVTLLTAADRLAARGEGPLASEEMIRAHLDLVREVLPAAIAWHREPPRPPLSGEELSAEVGVAPGPELGRLLERLRAASYAGEIADRDQALALARELAN